MGIVRILMRRCLLATHQEHQVYQIVSSFLGRSGTLKERISRAGGLGFSISFLAIHSEGQVRGVNSQTISPSRTILRLEWSLTEDLTAAAVT